MGLVKKVCPPSFSFGALVVFVYFRLDTHINSWVEQSFLSHIAVCFLGSTMGTRVSIVVFLYPFSMSATKFSMKEFGSRCDAENM